MSESGAGKFTRRAAILGSAAATIGAAFGIPKAVEAAQKALESLAESPAYGKYLALNGNRTLAVTETPETTKVQFVPIQGPTAGENQGQIVFRRNPKLGSETPLTLPPSQIKTDNAIRVFGGIFPGQNPLGETLGEITINYNGDNCKGGEWFKMVNDKQQPVDPRNGNVLPTNEKPYYVAANFITPRPTFPQK